MQWLLLYIDAVYSLHRCSGLFTYMQWLLYTDAVAYLHLCSGFFTQMQWLISIYAVASSLHRCSGFFLQQRCTLPFCNAEFHYECNLLYIGGVFFHKCNCISSKQNSTMKISFDLYSILYFMQP